MQPIDHQAVHNRHGSFTNVGVVAECGELEALESYRHRFNGVHVSLRREPQGHLREESDIRSHDAKVFLTWHVIIDMDRGYGYDGALARAFC
ncbi:MAG TPA: hypothetical protein VH593_20650 [Ktedonobacteraceae bacterium]